MIKITLKLILLSLLLVGSYCLLDSQQVAAANSDASASATNGVVSSELDWRSFEVVAEIRDHRSVASILMEERYSAQQARGLVRQTTRYIKDKQDPPAGRVWERNWDTATRVYVVDSKESISMMRNVDKSICEPIKPDVIMRTLGFDFIDFNMGEHEYIFGAARLLYYFSRMGSEIRAKAIGSQYRMKNMPCVRYVKSYKSADSGVVVEVSVFYSAISTKANNHEHALPVMVQLRSPLYNYDDLSIEFSTVRFTDGDSLGDGPVPEARPQLDALMLEPVSGCSEAVPQASRHESPWPELEHTRELDRFSFRASVRTTRVPIRSNDEAFDVQVAFDSWLNKMRVDLSASDKMPVSSSAQIFDFTLNQKIHILARPEQGKYDFVNELIEANQPKKQDSSAVECSQPGRSYRCASAAISSLSAVGSITTLTLDYLMLGTSKDFVYMGLARVRGVRARVYEAANTQLPFWLDPEMNYGPRKPAQASTGSSGGGSNRPKPPVRNYVTLVYFSVPNAETDTRLLLIEIYEMDSGRKAVLGKHDISVFDFAWNLQIMGVHPIGSTRGLYSSATFRSSGDSALGLFSLVNYCSEWGASESSSDGDGQVASESHARMEMILESAEPVARYTHKWLEQHLPVLRATLLSSLQLDMNIIIGLIYDLKTRFIEHPNGGSTSTTKGNDNDDDETNNNSKQPFKLLVSFKIGRLPKKLTKLVYVGQGRRQIGKSWFLQVTSLHECFMIAAHLKFETELGYDPALGACYIFAEPSDPANRKQKEDPFHLDPADSLGVYRTVKEPEHHKITHEWWLREPLIANDYRKRRIRLATGRPQDATIKLNIEQLIIHEHKPRVFSDDGGGSMDSTVSADVMLGLGFLEQTGISQAVHLEPMSLTTTNANEADDELVRSSYESDSSSLVVPQVAEELMTLGQCQAMCLADFACRSVSYCVRGSKISCILSQADLTKREIVAKISSMLIKDQTTATATKGTTRKLEVQLDDGRTVELVASRACTIYSKKYLSYYEKEAKGLVHTSGFRSLRPVESADECASECFELMLNSLRNHNETLSSWLIDLEQEIINSNESDHESQSSQLLERGKLLNEAIKIGACYKFYYIDATYFSTMSKGARASLELLLDNNDPNTTTGGGGYCALMSSKQSPESAHFGGQHQIISADSYSMKLDQLYEESYGVQLKPSKLSPEQATALNQVRFNTNRGLNVASIEIVRGLLKSGENFQLSDLVVNKKQCASSCFTQSAGMWPVCRSFDIVIQQQQITETENRTQIRCILNSLSRKQALEMSRLDLIDTSRASDPHEQHWHYELKEGLLSMQQVNWQAETLPRLIHQDGNQNNSYISLVMVICSIALGLCLGLLVMGMVMYKRLQRNTRKRDSTSSGTEFRMSTSIINELHFERGSELEIN